MDFFSQNKTTASAATSLRVYAIHNHHESSDWFCQRTDEALQGLSGYAKIVDDIIIFAKDQKELYNRISAILQICKENNIILSKRKFQVGTKISFAGYIVSKDGIQPDPDKLI